MAIRAFLLAAACAMTLDLAHSACVPCDDVCADEGAKLKQHNGDECLCEHGDGNILPPQKYTCAGGCCSRNLEEGQVGTTKVGGDGETQELDGGDGGSDGGDDQGYCTNSPQVNATGIDCASYVDKFDCIDTKHNGACEWHTGSHDSGIDPDCASCEFEAGSTWCWSAMGSPYCAKKGITHTCDKKDGANVPAVTQRSDCPGAPATAGHDSGDSDQDSDHGFSDSGSGESPCSKCVDACAHTLSPPQRICTSCIGGTCRATCDAEHGVDAVQAHIDAGCPEDSDSGSDGSDHDGSDKCGSRHNPADRDCCAPNGEEMFCHDGWVPKRNGKGCGSWVAANEWKEDPNGQFECHRPENDERAKYCGEGTEWRGSDLGCVATAEGAIRACERHRGEQWAFTCRPIDTCDNNHGNRYQNPCKDTSQFTPEMPWGGHCSGDELHDGKGNTKDRCENSLKCNWSSQCTDVGDAGHEDCCHCETPSACEATGAIWEERTCDTPIKEHWDWLFGLTCEQETRYGNAGDILRGWGHQCCANHESICGGVAHDLGWVQEFKCHHDNITGLQADTGQKVMSCERSLCDKNAFAAEGAPTHWYESMCCATCDFSPKDGNWGVSPSDEYLACAQQHCPLGTQWFVNTTTGQAITADTRWGEDADFVFQIMQQHPEATEGVECACRHCGHHLTEEMWPAGPRVCRAVMGSPSPSSSHW